MITVPGLGTWNCHPWVEVQSDVLAWHDNGRKDWIGHVLKIGDDYSIVDRVEGRGDGVWRLHLIASVQLIAQSSEEG